MSNFTLKEKQVIAGALRCYIEKENLPEDLKSESENILESIKRELKQMDK
jgi:hypothetical protein